MTSLGSNRPHDELPYPYCVAVDAILAEPVPEMEIDIQQFISVQATPAAINPNRRRFLRKVAAYSIAAAVAGIMLAVVWLIPRHSDAWDGVIHAVQTVPWIHAKSVSPQGRIMESWMSPSQRIMASRDESQIDYEDIRSGILEEYDPASKVLVRLPARDSANDLASICKIFFSGEAAVGTNFSGFSVVEEKLRTGADAGGTWKELELTLGGVDRPIAMTLHINSKNNLPMSAECQPKDVVKTHIDFDYPEKGPTDIYALGVPQDTPISDRIPPKDLQTVLGKLDTSFHSFGDYVAIVGQKRGIPDRILRFKGEKWRMDLCIPTDRVEKLALTDQQLIEGTNQTSWWKNRLKQFDTQPVLVCDGEHVYRLGLDRFGKDTPGVWNIIRDPGARWEAMSLQSTTFFFVEGLAFPPIKPSSTWQLSLRASGDSAPTGTTVLETKGDSPSNMYKHMSYWLEPKFGYAVVKHELLGGTRHDNPYDPYPYQDLDMTNLIREFAEFKRSPKGLWYPTVVRWKNAIAKKNTDGQIERRDLMTYFYLDFTMKMPDELFDIEKQ